MPLLSIVVPYYNVDRYIGECLESVRLQTLTDFEVILVDDGSLDGSRDHAQAYVDRATALKALGRTEEAADAYEAALAREAEFPNLKTQAYLALPVLVATEGLLSRFDRAITILDEQADRLMFPVDHFLWHAARALIVVSRGDRTGAGPHARAALEAASKDHSGFRYHPSVGLVTEKHRGLLKDIAALGAA